MAKTVRFTREARDLIASVYPELALAEEVQGSAPQLIYTRSSPEHPRLVEKLALVKLRHGIAAADVMTSFAFRGPGVGGEKEYALGAIPVDTRIEELRVPLDKDFTTTLRFKLAILEDHTAPIREAHRSADAARMQLADGLPSVYRAWRSQLKPELSTVDAMLASESELQGVDEQTSAARRHKLFPYPLKALQQRRFDDFVAFLVANGRLSDAKDPAGRWLIDFWQRGRPVGTEELKTDKFVGDPCGRCAQFKTRGKVAQKLDATFGPHAEFVCSSCAKD